MAQFNEVDQSTFEFVLRVDRTGDGSAALRIEILRKNAAVPSAWSRKAHKSAKAVKAQHI